MNKKLIAVLFCVLMCGLGLHADEMMVGQAKYSNIRIFKVEAGEVDFRSGSMSNKAKLDRVSGVRITNIPEMAQGEDALAKGGASTAVRHFEKALSKAKDDVRPLVQARLIVAYDKAGKFGDAVKTFRRLMTNHPQVASLVPSNYPTDAAGQKKALAEIDKQLGWAKNKQSKDALGNLRAAVASGQQVKKEEPKQANTNRGGTTQRPVRVVRTRVNLPAGVRKKFEEGAGNSGMAASVEELANEWLTQRLGEENSDGDWAFIYYYRGVAEKTQNKNKQAIISMMRVIAHYGNSKFAAPAALEAAGIYLSLHMQNKGKLQSALRLAKEAEQMAGRDAKVKGAAKDLQRKIDAALKALG